MQSGLYRCLRLRTQALHCSWQRRNTTAKNKRVYVCMYDHRFVFPENGSASRLPPSKRSQRHRSTLCAVVLIHFRFREKRIEHLTKVIRACLVEHLDYLYGRQTNYSTYFMHWYDKQEHLYKMLRNNTRRTRLLQCLNHPHDTPKAQYSDTNNHGYSPSYSSHRERESLSPVNHLCGYAVLTLSALAKHEEKCEKTRKKTDHQRKRWHMYIKTAAYNASGENPELALVASASTRTYADGVHALEKHVTPKLVIYIL